MEGASNAFARRHQSPELRLRVVTLEKCFEMRRVHSRPLLGLEESALMLGIGRSTLYRAVKDGNVPFPVHKIGAYWYVPRASLQRFLDGAGASEGTASDR